MSDVIDEVLRIKPGDRLDRLRSGPEVARLRSQTNWTALFEPAQFGAVSARERFAAAARVAEISGADSLAHFYGELRDRQREGNPARTAAILAHAEKIGRAPGEGSREDLARLAEAGLAPAEIVTLSQIIGFVSYQARVVATLSVLGATS
jgi:uncharacterized protein YciW